MEKLENDLMKVHGPRYLNVIQEKLRQIDPKVVSGLTDSQYHNFLAALSSHVGNAINNPGSGLNQASSSGPQQASAS